MNPEVINIVAAVLFGVAILHTFTAGLVAKLGKKWPNHEGFWHLLGEVEVVFGFWATILVLFLAVTGGMQAATGYVESRNFTEPMFVFVIMVMAATRPILQLATDLVRSLARVVRLPGSMGLYLVVLGIVPLLGSFITEPAAMTLAAMVLAGSLFNPNLSTGLKYATIGVLFVNVSIGGTLTNFAAPPVLMVAGAWGWDLPHMFLTFGGKAALAVLVNASIATFLFRRELASVPQKAQADENRVPWPLVAAHVACLALVVVFAHDPAMFMGVFLLFLGITTAYSRYQDKLLVREALLVSFFLAGLVVLGGMQSWWLQPILAGMSANQVFLGATALTAITDNAALTYLGSLVQGLSDEFKYALVAGAVTGGGLTIIANAPNPAGAAILRKFFKDAAINPLFLLLAALVPTIIAACCFWFLR